MKNFIKQMRHFIKKLNIFDYLLILALVVIVTIFLILRYSKQEQWVSVRLKVKNTDLWWEAEPVSYWYFKNLREGDIAYNSFGQAIAKLKKLQVFDSWADRNKAFVELELKTTYDSNKKIYLFNYQPLQIGDSLELIFGKQNLQGIITHINDEEIQYQDIVVWLEMRRLEPYIADSYKPDKQITDQDGNVLAEIMEAQQKPFSFYQYSDIRGKMIKVFDPDYLDVQLKILLKATKYRDAWFFIDGSALKIGENIWLFFDDTLIKDAKITRLEPVNKSFPVQSESMN